MSKCTSEQMSKVSGASKWVSKQANDPFFPNTLFLTHSTMVRKCPKIMHWAKNFFCRLAALRPVMLCSMPLHCTTFQPTLLYFDDGFVCSWMMMDLFSHGKNGDDQDSSTYRNWKQIYPMAHHGSKDSKNLHLLTHTSCSTALLYASLHSTLLHSTPFHFTSEKLSRK